MLAGQWHHVKVIRSQQTTVNPDEYAYEVEFYIDGELDTVDSYTSGYWDEPGGLELGEDDRIWLGGTGNYTPFDGKIDEIRIKVL